MSQRLVFRLRLRGAALAVWLACAAAPSWAAPDAEADAALARAREQVAAGRLYPAEQQVRAALEREPERAEAHRLLGHILLLRRKPAAAVAALERADALAPGDPALERELAEARFEAGDWERAREDFTRALERTPNDADLLLKLGRCELELDRPDRAAELFERAAQDPEYRQVALYNVGVARERAGEREAAREAFERALEQSSSPLIADRAWTHLRALERTEGEHPWHLGVGAGLLYDSNVRRPEVDRASGEPDGAGQFELTASYELPVRDWFELHTGYDFYQSLYFDATDFDLQSHTFHATPSRQLDRIDVSLGYVYSLNTLGGSRFLDFHELRPAVGLAAAQWWYASLAPALRVKRFADDSRRDAEQGALALLQLFALGDWDRRLLVSLEGQLEDAGREFDYRGFTTLSELALPIPLFVERQLQLGLRYRFRYRDYTHAISSPTGGHRRDRIHSARARLELPVAAYVAIRLEYEFEDATSDVQSADYTNHTVGGSLRFEM